jgi:hypothetical protein
MRVQGSKRSNWKQNLLITLKEAAQDLGDSPPREIDQTIGITAELGKKSRRSRSRKNGKSLRRSAHLGVALGVPTPS